MKNWIISRTWASTPLAALPHFRFAPADCGYVADYTGVAPEYGTLDDFKTFGRSAPAACA